MKRARIAYKVAGNDARYVDLCEANELIYRRRDSGRQFINIAEYNVHRVDYILWRSQIDLHSGMSLCETQFLCEQLNKSNETKSKKKKIKIKIFSLKPKKIYAQIK